MTTTNPRRESSRHTFAVLTAVLVTIVLVSLALAALIWALTRPLPASVVAATRAAQPPARATPTPIPTLAGVTAELLVCQRQAGLAMHARQMVGAANLSGDRELRLRWVSTAWAVDTLDDALPGVIPGLDAALEVWENGCALYDRVEIEVFDRRKVEDSGRAEEQQVPRLTVRAKIDDLIAWRAGKIGDVGLLERIEVIRAGEN